MLIVGRMRRPNGFVAQRELHDEVLFAREQWVDGARSSLSVDHRAAALGLSEEGAGTCAVATQLRTSVHPIRELYDRWSGLTRHLTKACVNVREVDRPDRSDHRRKPKDDDVDAINAARAAKNNRRTTTPKSKDVAVETLLVLMATRAHAVQEKRFKRSTVRCNYCGWRSSPLLTSCVIRSAI